MRSFLAPLMLILLLALPAAAQWGWVESPMHGDVTEFRRLPSGGLLLGTTGGIFASTDGGASWFFTGIGSIHNPNAGNQTTFDAYEDADGSVYIAMENVWEGSASLNDFVPFHLPWPVYGVESIEKFGDTWILSSELEIWRSTDDLASFETVFEISPIWNDITGVHVNPVDGTWIAHMNRVNGCGMLLSEDDGQTWTDQPMPGINGEWLEPVITDDGRMYFVQNYQNTGYIRYTDDYGETTTLLYEADENWELDDLILFGDSNIASMRHPGIVISEDMGASWSFDNLPDFIPQALAHDGNTLLAGCEDGVRASTDFTDWTLSSEGLACVRTLDGVLSADGDAFLFGSGFLWGQQDGTWGSIPVLSDADAYFTTAHETSSGRLIVLGRSNDGGAPVGSWSDDGGMSWTAASGFSGGNWSDFLNVVELSDGTLLAGHEAMGVQQSTDDGATWSTLSAEGTGTVQAAGDGTLYTQYQSTIRRSTDDGASWEDITGGLFGPEGIAVSPTGDAVFARTFSALHRLGDDDSWNSLHQELGAALPTGLFEEILAIGYGADGTLYVALITTVQATGKQYTAMLSSTDDGDSFTLIDAPGRIASAVVTAIKPAANGETIAISNMGMFASGLTAGAEETDTEQVALPARFSLAQNYPNPFNPTTTIAFNLPAPTRASIVVHDMLGREVARLIDGSLGAGQHQVVLNASTWSSGVYLYTLTAGPRQTTRRMTLVK